MADSAAQILEVVRRLRADGHTVIEVPGWPRRGTGPMTTRGRVEHHTATPRTARGDAPTLRVVIYGHGRLKNSLCRWYVSRTGVIYLVALRTSWHAGRGVKGTNSTLSGTEAEHSGRSSEPWSPASLEAQAAISRHECAVLSVPTSRVWEHKEHAPSRKSDRIGIDGPAWRRRLLTEPVHQEDIMASLDDVKQAVAAAVEPIANRVATLGKQLSDHHQTANRGVRLGRAGATAAVARLRTEVLGLSPSPESDQIQVDYLENGRAGKTYTWADLERRLRAAKARGEDSSPPADPAIGAEDVRL